MTKTRFVLFSTDSIAGFTAGSIPIIGIEYFWRSSDTAILVAVLQAITMIWAPSFTKNSMALKTYSRTSSFGFGP